MDIAKDKRIKAEKRRLGRIFAGIDDKRRDTVQSLMDNAAFMAVTLEDLQAQINESGVVSKYQNGENQWGTKKSPEVEIYNTMIKNYTAIVKQLTDLLPEGEEKEDDGFEQFVHNR